MVYIYMNDKEKKTNGDAILGSINGMHNFDEIKRIIDALSNDEKKPIDMPENAMNDIEKMPQDSVLGEENMIIKEEICINSSININPFMENLNKDELKSFHNLSDIKNNQQENELHKEQVINNNKEEESTNNFLKMMISNYFKSNEWKEILRVTLQEMLLNYFKENQTELFRHCLTNEFVSNLKQNLSNTILSSEYTLNYTQNLLEKTLCGEILYKLAERQIKEIILKKLST
jgi:hypothetical protein